MLDDKGDYFFVGFFVGIGLMILVWICVAQQIERSKIKAGYLTFQNKTYKVTLYDILERPPQSQEK